MNYMKQVAQMLGLEWDDEKQESELFYIKSMPFICQIRENGCYLQQSSLDLWIQNSRYLMDILLGDLIIKKYPWKPRDLEQYFFVTLSSPDLYSSQSWIGNDYDEYRYNNNLVYKTAEEALAEAERILQLRKEADK